MHTSKLTLRPRCVAKHLESLSHSRFGIPVRGCQGDRRASGAAGGRGLAQEQRDSNTTQLPAFVQANRGCRASKRVWNDSEGHLLGPSQRLLFNDTFPY